jgi:hypothetical protein
MAEIAVKIDVPEEFREEFKLALSRITEQFSRDLKLLMLQERLKSRGEKELTDWSVKLGRKAKKDSFQKLVSELTSEERREIFE